MSELADNLERFIAARVPVQVLAGEVVAVRPDELACDVRPDTEDADLVGVALLNGIYPAVGAQAWVGLIGNRRTDTFLIAADPVAHYQLATEQESLHTLLQDIVSEVRALKFTTNNGPTIKLLTDLNWEKISARIDKLFRP